MPYVPRKPLPGAGRRGGPGADRPARAGWPAPAGSPARRGWLPAAALVAVLAAGLLYASVTGAFTSAHASPVAAGPVTPAPVAGPVRASAAPADDMPMGDMSGGDMHAGSETYGNDGAPVPVANFGVLDQVSDGRTMQVGDAEVNGSPAWVVVQRDSGGRPGAVVGLTRRLNGEHGSAATVTFTEPVATGRFWVSLHRDLGVPDSYEFPGPDVAVTSAGSELSRQITVTVR